MTLSNDMIGLLIASFTAELPVFLLILHMSNRIVKLETQMDLMLKMQATQASSNKDFKS